jgi:dihydrofolate reductase
MGRLIYLTLTSFDGFIGDGDYSWSVPDEEVMAALIADLAKVGTYVYGRRTYETMAVWEADPAWAAQSPEDAKFASTWQAADKVVFSSTLAQVSTSRTRLERQFDAQVVEAPERRSRSSGLGAHAGGTKTRGRRAPNDGPGVRRSDLRPATN